MTPAEWLAAILLGWAVVGGLWRAFDEPVTMKLKSTFYLVVGAAVQITVTVLACVVLSIPALGAIAVFALVVCFMAIGEAARS